MRWMMDDWNVVVEFSSAHMSASPNYMSCDHRMSHGLLMEWVHGCLLAQAWIANSVEGPTFIDKGQAVMSQPLLPWRPLFASSDSGVTQV